MIKTFLCQVYFLQLLVMLLKLSAVFFTPMILKEDLLTGCYGPKAFDILNTAKLNVDNEVQGIVRDAVKSFNE